MSTSFTIHEPGSRIANMDGIEPIRPVNNQGNRPANKPLTLDDVSSAFAERELGLSRDPFPISNIRIEPLRLIAGEKEYRLDDVGFRRLCTILQAPADYLKSLRPKLRSHVLQTHIAERRFRRSKLSDLNSCIVSRDGMLLDLGRTDLFTLNNAAVLRATSEGIEGDHASLQVHNFQMDDESFAFDVVSPQVVEEVRPGDVIHGGVHVSHSQLTGSATQVMAYIVRLICSNGARQRRCLGSARQTPRTRRLSASKPEAMEMQKEQVRKLVAETWRGLEKNLTAIRSLQPKNVKDVKASMEQFLRQAHLFSKDLMDQLMIAWEIEGAERTAFGTLNALTRVATHSTEIPTWKRHRLARLAGIYANQDVHLCPHCFSVLKKA